MAGPRKPTAADQKLADGMAGLFFTNDHGQVAESLVLEGPNGEKLGSWTRQRVARILLRLIARVAEKAAK